MRRRARLRSLVAACATAAAAVTAAPAPAAAEPAVVLDACATLDRVALRAAIARELPPAPADPRALAVRDELTLVVHCSDPVAARISVELPRPALPLVRYVDLGEVPPELRIKLLAVAAAELLEAALVSRLPPPPPPAVPDAGPARAPLPGERLPGVRAPGGPAQRAIDGGDPAVGGGGFSAARPGSGITASSAGPARARSPLRSVDAGAGVRHFASGATTLAHAAVETRWPWFALGASASYGTATDPLGSLSAYVIAATAAAPPLCAGGAVRACARVRGELGAAIAQGRPVAPMTTGHGLIVSYAQLGLALGTEVRLGAVAAMIAVEAAWAEGLVATAQDRRVIALDGATLTAIAGLRWLL